VLKSEVTRKNFNNFYFQDITCQNQKNLNVEKIIQILIRDKPLFFMIRTYLIEESY